jgi:hypothetical protein
MSLVVVVMVMVMVIAGSTIARPLGHPDQENRPQSLSATDGIRRVRRDISSDSLS